MCVIESTASTCPLRLRVECKSEENECTKADGCTVEEAFSPLGLRDVTTYLALLTRFLNAGHWVLCLTRT